MVKGFYKDLSENELGSRVGLLGSAYFIGQVCGSSLWGRLSDRIGRRPVLVSGLLGTTFSMVAFGLSPNYA